MSIHVAPQIPEFVEGEVRLFTASFAKVLDAGELIASVVSVAEETTSDCTITNTVVNTATLRPNGKTALAGQAVQGKVSGFLASAAVRTWSDGPDSQYSLLITVTTDATPAQTLLNRFRFNVRP